MDNIVPWTPVAKPFVNPNFFPYNDDNFNGTWITIISKKLLHVTAFTGGEEGGLVFEGDSTHTWKFLAPESIQQSIVHVWQPWESVTSRLGGSVKEIHKVTESVGGIAKGLVKAKDQQSVKSIPRNIAQSTSHPNQKVDTPLVYQDTERLKLDFTVNLSFNNEDSTEIMPDLIAPVIALQRLSSPELKDINTSLTSSLGLPYAFQISVGGSLKNDLPPFIFLQVAALLSVQPTWQGPYATDTNYPTRCELTLSFISLKPTYANVWEDWKKWE